MTLTTLTVSQKRVGPVRGRHPWVFSGALTHIPDGIASGTAVRLVDEANNFLASGYFNSYSQIAIRLWGYQDNEEVTEDFFVKRIAAAYELRQNFVVSKDTDAYRLVNSENDLLPGLIVDKYADCLCVQFHNRGIEAWKDQIISALKKVVKPKGIYERSDVGNRAKEQFTTPPFQGGVRGGLPSVATPPNLPLERGGGVGVLFGKVPEKIKILENGHQFWVDVVNGQKTGFFLDQRDKRAALMKYCKGKTVLNCFSYTGGFSVYALAAGAKRVVSVDASESALAFAQENIKLNKFTDKKSELVCADVKQYLQGLLDKDSELGDNSFDVIILDPPAFIKDRHKIYEGVQGYRKINEAALRLLPAGGILVSASCSQHLSLLDFRHMLSEAAGRAGRTVQILETYTHGIDHPQLAAFTEGEYLKCVFALVN